MDFQIRIKWRKVILILVVLAIATISRFYFSKKSEKNIEENKKTAQAETQRIQKEIQEKIVQMNLTMTELPVADLNQQPTSLTAIRGHKTMAVYFTTADNLTMKGDLPIFLKLFEEKKNDMNFSVVVMEANEEETKEKINKFIAENKTTIPIYTSNEEEKSLTKFGITALPARLLVNKEGKIKGIIAGDGQLTENDLREMINQ